jgi:hypothetical protein
VNQRVKLLWEESQQWNGSDDGRGGLKILESVEKFAELIVKECIDIAQDRAAFDWAPPNDVNHIISEMKEHFGVE